MKVISSTGGATISSTRFSPFPIVYVALSLRPPNMRAPAASPTMLRIRAHVRYLRVNEEVAEEG